MKTEPAAGVRLYALRRSAGSPFGSAPLHGVNYIGINIIDDVYFSEIQVFYDPRQSRDGPPLDSNDEGDARPDKIRSRWY
jgi:hypothetical protein